MNKQLSSGYNKTVTTRKSLGLFIGGSQKWKYPMFPNFKGCISNLTIFGETFLTHSDTNHCSDYFSDIKSEMEMISLETPGSFAIFRLVDSEPIKQSKLEKIAFSIVSSTRNSLLFDMRSNEQVERFQLEIKEQTFYIVIQNHVGTWTSHSELVIADSTWHNVTLMFTNQYLELQVDDRSEKLFTGKIKVYYSFT